MSVYCKAPEFHVRAPTCAAREMNVHGKRVSVPSKRAPRARLVTRYARGVTVFAALTLGTACGEQPTDRPIDGESVGGSVFVAMAAEPATLFPSQTANNHENAITEIVYDRLADPGVELNTVGDNGFIPRLASSWRWSADSMNITFVLDTAARWHDGEVVTGDDVRATFMAYTHPEARSPTAPILANLDSVSVPSPAEATFWFKQRTPHQFFDATYHMFVMPAHRLRDIAPQDFASSPLARSPMGTGRFRFARWEPTQRIEIVSDTGNYRGRAILDRVVFVPTTDFGASTIKLFTGEVDFQEKLSLATVAEAARVPTLAVVTYPSLQYLHVPFNLRAVGARSRAHPVFGDRDVRRALVMGVDRARVVRTVYDSSARLGIGPAPRPLIPFADDLRQQPFDRTAARALLDSLGWTDTNGDGIRERNGVRLAFEIMVPSSSVERERMAVLLQDEWRQIGTDVSLLRLEVNALISRLESGRFDAFMGGWTVNPGLSGLRQVWSTRAIGAGGSNYGGYGNRNVDATLDTALTTFDPDLSRTALQRTLQMMLDDAPALWLGEPQAVAGMHRRIDPGVLPAIGYWHGLPDWRIRPGQQIDRDGIGLSAAP